MADCLRLTRIWQNAQLFEMDVVCQTACIMAHQRVYTTNAKIEELENMLSAFLSEAIKEAGWRSGTKGENSTACLSFRFCRADQQGNILAEVFLEMNDGGPLCAHHCCFCLRTEKTLLNAFLRGLKALRRPVLGTRVVLKNAGSE